VNAPRLFAAAGLATVLIFGSAGGCGAKTGLLVPQPEREDASVPAPLICGTFPVRTEPVVLEVFITLDTSGSMQETTASGETKLDAVRAAIEGFVEAPQSSGIGVSLLFFPIIDPEVPGLCMSDAICGRPQACKPLFVCSGSTDQLCGDSSQCPAGETCERLGQCVGSLLPDCVVGGPPCLTGDECLPTGYCDNQNTCEQADYKPLFTPPISLPAGAATIVATLASKEAIGGTPTAPALRGAIDSAAKRAESQPEHKEIVLLATDGFPSSCDPAIDLADPATGIPLVAAAAADGRARGIATFVIGVFAPSEEAAAKQNLDAIADAGGSNSAYIITTDQPVTQQMIAALNEIRKNASACDYVLPRPDGSLLDATKIKVRLRGSQGEVWLERKSSLGECGPSGGFVFDKDPFGPLPPSRVQLCPASCGVVEADPSVSVEVVVDCDPP
jgi:Mg-chelatase subunit ChlD